MGHSSIDIPTIFFSLSLSLPSSGGFVGTSAARIDLGPAGRPSHVFDSFASRALRDVNFSTPVLLLLFGSWPLVYGHPLRRGESRADGTYGKVQQAAIEIFLRPISNWNAVKIFFFFWRECVCFVLIVISYPQQLHGSITETTTHGTSTIYIESDSCCAEEVRDYWVYKVNDEFNFLFFFVCVRIDIAFRLKQSPSSTANLERFTGPTNDICCAREFLNNVIAPTFCLKSFLNKCTRREVNKFFK